MLSINKPLGPISLFARYKQHCSFTYVNHYSRHWGVWVGNTKSKLKNIAHLYGCLKTVFDMRPLSKNFYRPLSNFCKVNRPYFRCYHSYILPIRLPTFNWRSFDYLKLFISRLRGLSDEWLSHMRVAQSISQHRWRSKLHVRTIVYIRHVLAHHEGHGYK